MLTTFSCGQLAENCYLWVNDTHLRQGFGGQAHEAFVVDPGLPSPKLKDMIAKGNIRVTHILVTHCHFDHVAGIPDLVRVTGARVLMPAEEERLVPLSAQIGSRYGYVVEPFTVNQGLTDGEMLTIAGQTIQVIGTPGHSPMGLCFYLPKENILFSGDTLFYRTIGRTDIPGSNPRAMGESLKKILTTLPPETVVYPGHSRSTTIGEERDFQRV